MTYNSQHSLLAQLEFAVSDTQNRLTPFRELSSKATELNLNNGDCFVRLIYYSSQSGAVKNNLATQLREIAIRLNLFNFQGEAAFFTNLSSEMRDTYQSLTDGPKTKFYTNRIDSLYKNTLDLSILISALVEDTNELYENLISQSHKTTSEAISQIIIKKKDVIYDNRYNEALPETLYVAKNSIWFFKPLLYYFIKSHLGLKDFLLSTGYFETTIQIALSGSVGIASESKNNFNPAMDLADVEKWFIQLATNTSTNGSPFLTVEQVQQFIERAFVGNTTIQKLTINIADGERQAIVKLFYLYYQKCVQDYAIEPTKHCKEKYVRLLTDNFTNYNYKTVFDTFNNSKTAPKEWDTTI